MRGYWPVRARIRASATRLVARHAFLRRVADVSLVQHSQGARFQCAGVVEYHGYSVYFCQCVSPTDERLILQRRTALVALRHNHLVRRQGLADADHAVAGYELGQLFLAHAFGACGALGQY